MACRRRETSDTIASFFCYIFSSFWYLCLSLSHRENQGMLPVSRDDAAGRIWGLYRSGKQIKPDPVSRDDAMTQIEGLYRSGKQTTPDPASRPSSRYKSTKTHSKPSTTLHPNLLHSATNPSPVSLLKDRPLPPPSILTPAPPSPARRSMPSTMTPANPPCPTLPPLGLTRGRTAGETLILQMGSFFGMGLTAPGPKRFRPWPVYEVMGQTQVSTDKPQQPATIAEDFRTLPLRFIYRSEKSIVDDLEKTASRSMTTGLLLPCNLLF